MAGNSLDTSASLECPHRAKVHISSANQHVKDRGGALALATDTFTISDCRFQIPGTPPIPSPCVKVQWILPDMQVTVNGTPTLSESSVGLCLNAQNLPQGTVVIKSTQTKVKTR